MSLFSEQKVHCKACGTQLYRKLAGPGWTDLCDTDCHREFEWRETLSMMGKAYYPRPERS